MCKNPYDVIIIGAGVVGCACGRELSKYKLNVAVLEKNTDVSEGISKGNSGVVHAGFYVPYGTLKARTNVEGFFAIPKLAAELNFPYKKIGKLVISNDKYGLTELKRLKEAGDKNGCIGLEIITEKQISHIEPKVKAKYALFSKETAIISPYLFTIALVENALKNGVDFFLNHEVIKIWKDKEFFVQTKKDTFHSKWLINAAGLYSDKISCLAGDKNHKIFPCRGEYLVTDKDNEKIINRMIYPIPPKDGASLGVHITPTTDGNILIGPSAEFINNYGLENTKQFLNEMKEDAFKMVPELKRLPIIRTYSGIRPKLIYAKTKKDFRDFVIEESKTVPKLINIIGIESPGLAAAPAIANLVLNIIGNKENLNKNEQFDAYDPKKPDFQSLSVEEKKELIKKNPDFGEIICRCETITKGELLNAINNPLGVKTLDGIKRRCRAGMGRCQGGFCTPRTIKILRKEYGIKEKDILKNENNSNLFFGKIKE
ncbi:MAG: NAD(P)/FAD-dependent oxidoreductase [Desulfurellaceae bacterium]|nr:NAD(P)/FAD-dependent oxidoreductase [Desulfurellaceae bacterium]